MSTGIANWLQVNIINNSQVLESLIALIILIVASFLMSEKPTKKIPFKRILGTLLFVFAIFVFLYANIPNLADVFTVWATLVLAGVAVFSFQESRRLRQDNIDRERRDRKERLLKEIIEWATEIHTASLKTDLPKIDPSLELYIEEKAEGNQEIIEGIKRNIVNKEHYRIEVETLIKYSIPCSRAEYIRALASGNFGGHAITKIVDDIIDNLVALMFLRSMNIGIDNPREGFGESAIVIINRVEEELKNPVNTIDNSLKKYAKQLSGSVNALFTDAAKFISNL